MARSLAPARASVLIIAGGRGTRFWPASREAKPKPLFSVDGKTSLLADTIARHVPLIPRARIFVLVATAHQAAFRRALRGLIPARNLIVEPYARGTAVAIAYGAAVIKRRLGDGVIAAVAADHYISTAAQYRRTLADAIGLAATKESIVAIGIPPTRPETGYGYQQIGAKVGAGFRIEKFVEKPGRRGCAPDGAQRPLLVERLDVRRFDAHAGAGVRRALSRARRSGAATRADAAE